HKHLHTHTHIHGTLSQTCAHTPHTHHTHTHHTQTHSYTHTHTLTYRRHARTPCISVPCNKPVISRESITRNGWIAIHKRFCYLHVWMTQCSPTYHTHCTHTLTPLNHTLRSPLDT